MNGLDRLVRTAHGDAWQAEGRLRAPQGGGAAELPGVRLMASGLPHPSGTTATSAIPQRIRPWIEPHLGAAGFTVALAALDGEPVGIATAIRTDERAGACVGIFGVGVIERARRRGIGAALTSWLLERALADGATLAHLNPNDEAAARLYAGLGFVETAGLDVYVDR